MKKKILIELLWLFAIIALGLIIVKNLGFLGSNFALDIHLHDTYFVISPWEAVVPTASPIGFFVYFIKEWKQRFSRPVQNGITLLFGVSLIIVSTFCYAVFSNLAVEDSLTVYPPLSGLGTQSLETHSNNLFTFLAQLSIGLQLATVIGIIILSYKWGKSRK